MKVWVQDLFISLIPRQQHQVYLQIHIITPHVFMQHSWYEQNNKLYSYCLILILGAESGKTDLPISWFTTRLICFVIYSLLMWQGRHSLSGRYKIFSHLTTLIYVNRYLSQKLDKIIEDNHVWQKSETKKSKNQNSVPLKIQAARLCHTTLLFWARNSCINFAASIYKKKKVKNENAQYKKGMFISFTT